MQITKAFNLDHSNSIRCARGSDTDVKWHNFMIKTAFETKVNPDIHKIPTNKFVQLDVLLG
uniref:Uncharacterized protein n=1 Tax=Heterorhabditis bacteriophora TaxID=37862 RepID=A0A1I7X243_HETBA